MEKSKKSLWRKVLCFLIALGVVFMTPFAVYADDYDYIPIDDIEQYNAYKFWSLYGYELDYTRTISYSINETGTYTYSGTLTGTVNGSELTTFNVSLSNTISSLDETAGITYGSNGSIFGFNSSDDVLRLYIDPVDSIYHYYASSYGCEVGTWADTSTGDREANVWRCNPNTAYGHDVIYEPPAYELTLGGINIDTTENGWVQVVLKETGNGSGGMSGTLSLNESESVSGSGTINLSGTESTTGHKNYDIPTLNLKNYNFPRSWTTRLNTINKNNPTVISFLSDEYKSTPFSYYDDFDKITQSNVTTKWIGDGINFSSYYLWTVEVYSNDNKYIWLDMNEGNRYSNVIPIYIGLKNNMSDKLYRYIYGSDRTDTLLESGNSNSQQAINNNNTITHSFSQAYNGMHNIETTWENNLDTNMQNIPTSSSMYNNNKFIATANWVRTQFERIVLNTPFELLLAFSLILGIALVLIGKVR